MSFMDLVNRRESCRAFSDKPVEREKLIQIAEAGRLTPSGCNAQPWKFIVCDEPEAKAAVCDGVVVDGGKTGAPWRESVPAFIVMVELPAPVKPVIAEYYGDTQRFAQGDIGMAALNMCYEALDLGLGTCIIGMNDQKKMEEGLGIPEGYECRGVIAIGYPAEVKEPRAKVRKAFDEAVSFNKF